jgi:hypothetical protein
MGLCNAPSVFQRMMNNIFHKQLHKSVVIYLDDLLIFSKTIDEHLKHLEEVFQIIKQHGLSLKQSKCHFFQRELRLLGFQISKEGLKPTQEKTQVIHD